MRRRRSRFYYPFRVRSVLLWDFGSASSRRCLDSSKAISDRTHLLYRILTWRTPATSGEIVSRMKQFCFVLLLLTSSIAFGKTLKNVGISPQGAVLQTGSSQQFKAVCTYSDSSTDDCTAAGGVVWSSTRSSMTTSKTGLATWISDPDRNGEYNGYAFEIASAGGMYAKAGVFGQHPGDVYYQYITPDVAHYTGGNSLAVGATIALGMGFVINDDASGGQPTGSPFNVQCTWTSSNQAIATVNTLGDVTGVAPGLVTITCGNSGNGAFGRSAIAGWQSPGNFINLAVVAGGTSHQTWYIRPQGGTPYTNASNTPNGQCDGKHDADYPGSGVNQPCAFNNFRNLWSDDQTYQLRQWVIAGGDTVIVRQNPAGYLTGARSTGTYDPTNCAGDHGNCYMPSVPSGTASQHTRILGENYASCHSDSAKTLLYGSYGANTVFNLKDSQFVDVACFEVTDQAACSGNGNYTHNCGTPGNANYGTYGVLASALTASSNLTDLFIHGLDSDGWHGAVGLGVVADHIHIRGMPDAGINMDDNPWYSGNISVAGGFTLTNSTTEFTGCVEEYPVVHNYPYIECRDQSTGSYGDGFGTASTTGDWVFDHDLWRYNFQDGLDLLHSGMHSLQVTNSTSYGNDGQQFKIGSGMNVLFENNLTLHNCLRIGQLFGDEPASAIVPGVSLCRAAGDGIPVAFDGAGADTFRNNTYVGYGAVSYDLECAGGWDSCGNTSTVFQNNINVGITNTNYNVGQAPGLFYLEQSYMPANGGWATRDHNSYIGFRNGCGALLAGEICADPKLVGEPPLTISNEQILDNFNFDLSVSSPLKAAGISIAGLTLDNVGNSYGSPPSMGAIQFGVSPLAPALSAPLVGLVASSATIVSGQAVTFSATVSGTAGVTPTGSVVFVAGGLPLATVVLNSTGTAIYTTAGLANGTDQVRVGYDGDVNYAPATSATLVVAVEPLPSTAGPTSPIPTPVQTPAPPTLPVPGPSSPTTPGTGGISISVGQPEYGFNVLPSSVRRLFATVVQGTTNDVTWTVKSGAGTLSSTTGSWVDVTAPAAGTSCAITGSAPSYQVHSSTQFTIEAASADDPTAKTDVTFNVCDPPVQVAVVPFYRALYANQPEDLQSLVLGSVNQNVHWTIASQPNGGDGKLGDTTSRDTVFVASIPGRYKLVATSTADPTKSAYATVFVSGNKLPYVVTRNATEPIDCSVDPAMLGTVYNVGPSQAIKRLQDLSFLSIAPGSTIRVHNEDTSGLNPTVYREYIQLSQAGTADQPIRLCGVANNMGELPILDGAKATGRADIPGASAGLGVVTLESANGYQDYPSFSGPAYLTVEGLQIRNASAGQSYTAPSGVPAAWSDASACIYVAEAQNVALLGNDLSLCGIGAASRFDPAKGWGGTDMNLLWEGNHVHGNGSASSSTAHQMSLQAWGEVVQFNRIDAPVANTLGANLDARGLQGIVRYNYFGDGVAKQLDLGDIPSASTYMSFSGLLDGGSSSHFAAHAEEAYPADRVAAEQEAWNSHYVYGNIYLNSASLTPIRFGADGDAGEAGPKGNLFWYNNTFRQEACASCTGQTLTFFDTANGPASKNTQVEFQTVQSFSNIIWMDSTTVPAFQWNDTAAFIGVSGRNLLPSGWGSDSMAGGAGTGWNVSTSGASYQNATNLAAHLDGFNSADLVTTSTIPFDPTSWVLKSSEVAGLLVPSSMCEMPVRFSYLPDVGYVVPRTSLLNLGATDTTQQAAAEMTSLTGTSQYNSRFSNCR